MIRELREEVEKLRAMLGSGGGGAGGEGVSGKEMAALQEKLKISESLMGELTKSWEQKLADTERIHQVGGAGEERGRGLLLSLHCCRCMEKSQLPWMCR